MQYRIFEYAEVKFSYMLFYEPNYLKFNLLKLLPFFG